MGPINYQGHQYRSLYALAKKFGIQHNCLAGRLRRGWCLERAMTEPVEARRPHGRVAELSEKSGIPVKLLNHRLRHGWSEERACTQPPQVRRASIITQALADAAGLPLDIVRERVGNGWSMARALSEPRRTKGSRFKGLTVLKPGRRWRAQLYHAGKSWYLGEFTDELEAARAYDEAVRRHTPRGAWARKLNWPEA